MSYKWEDKKYADGLKGYLKNPNNMYRHVSKTERDDYRDKGENFIKNYLKEIIGMCDALICLVGQNTHSSRWVSYELDVANSQQKPIVPIRIRSSNGGAPNLIKQRKIDIIEWDAKKINDALSKE